MVRLWPDDASGWVPSPGTSDELLPRSQLDAELAGTFWSAARPALFNCSLSRFRGRRGSKPPPPLIVTNYSKGRTFFRSSRSCPSDATRAHAGEPVANSCICVGRGSNVLGSELINS